MAVRLNVMASSRRGSVGPTEELRRQGGGTAQPLDYGSGSSDPTTPPD
jgi:hypothetical protein